MQCSFNDENFLSNSFDNICSQKVIDYLEWVYKIKEENESRVNEEDVKNEGHDIYFFIKDDFPNELNKYLDNLNLNPNLNINISGSSQNSGNHSVVPYIKFVDENNEDFYIAYLVKADMSGFYLTLILRSRNYPMNTLKDLKDKFLDKFNYLNNFFFKENMSFENINLKCKEEWGEKETIPEKSKCDLPKQYELGTILSIEYEKNNLNENNMKEDLLNMLHLYGVLIDFHFGDIIRGLDDELFDIFLIHKNLFGEKFLDNMSDDIIKDFKNKFFSYIQSLASFKYAADLNIDINFKFKESIKNPSLNICYNNVSNDLNKGFYIVSKFNLNDNYFDIGFSLKKSNFDFNIRNSAMKYLFDFIKNNFNLENFNINDEFFNLELLSDEIIFYSIDSNCLSPEKLNEIYQNIISIYEELIPIYICFIFKNEIMNKIELIAENEQINMNHIELNELLGNFVIDETIVKDICSFLNTDNIILRGVPGTGKTHIANKLAELGFKKNFNNGYIMTTATSDWSTFDTIGGLMPDEDGKLFFNPGIFLEAIKHNKWLIIDEINRADIDKAFGQLFTVLSGHDVQLPFKINNHYIKLKKSERNSSYYDGNFTYYIGTNWRIIGTMNTMDKDTLFDLSYAFMRRFRFIDIEIPEREDYLNLMSDFAGDLNNTESINFNDLYEFNTIRNLGPAIFKDMFNYINNRVHETESEINQVLPSAIISCIIPQFDGVSNTDNIEKILKKYDFDENAIKKIINNLTIDL